MIRISPSLLSADFADFGGACAELQRCGADMVHCDVMDGRFVANITFGQPMIRALRRSTSLPLDVHLMIEDPIRYIAEFADAGADIITVHAEACTHLHRAVQLIKACGKKAGVALNPGTSPDAARYVLDDVDLLLCMSVNPGFGGQKFIPSSLQKLAELRRMIDGSGREIMLEVDGGVGAGNVGAIKAAGADTLVAGNSVFTAPDKAEAIRALREA